MVWYDNPELADPRHAANLDDLLAALRSAWVACAGIQTDSLPTFGGEKFDRYGVWSWDSGRLLIRCDGQWHIISRDQYPDAMRGGPAIDEANT